MNSATCLAKPRRFRGLARLLAACLLLAPAETGCASIPISTMAKLGGFDDSDFAAIDPRDVRVRVQVPEGVAIDPEGSVLSLSFNNGTVTSARNFALTFDGEDIATVSAGFFARELRVRRQTMKLSEPGIEFFREAQQAVRQGTFKPQEFKVNTHFAKFPPDMTTLRMWIDLQLSAKDGLFPLLDDVSIPITREDAE